MAFYMAPTPPDFGAQNTTTTGSSTAASFRPTSNSVPVNGVFLPNTNTVGIAANSSERITVTPTNVGIGTASPNSNLEVAGNSGTTTPTLRISNLFNGTPTELSQTALEFYSADVSSPAGASVRAKIDVLTNANGGNSDGLRFFVNGSSGSLTQYAVIDGVGNFKIGGTVNRSTTAGTSQLVLYNGTAPVGTLANGVSLYSSAGTLMAMDAAGAVTTLGPNIATSSTIRSSGATAGIGYATGAGSAQVQGTSRTTTVVANNVCGSIQLFSAAGSTTWTSFTVTNSAVAATDTVIVVQRTGTDLYEIHVTAVAAGSFRISFRTTGGTTTETPIFNFAVIKAVAA